jgi:hypothetical protein
MTAKTSTYPLRLPVSIKAEAEKLTAQVATSLNQFVATAIAESVLRTASYFAEHKGRADWEAFDRLMTRAGGGATSWRDALRERQVGPSDPGRNPAATKHQQRAPRRYPRPTRA